MAGRVRTVAGVQITVCAVLLIAAIAFDYRAAATVAALGVTVTVAIVTWLLARHHYASPLFAANSALWAIALAVVWRWIYDWGVGPGVLLFALPIAGVAYGLGKASSAWWMAGLCSAAYAVAAWWGLSLPEDAGTPILDQAVALALTLAGIWGMAALVWAGARAWQRDRRALEQYNAAAAGERERCATRIAELEQQTARQAQQLDSLSEWVLPAIAVYERVIVLPLAGYLDEARAGQARATLLHAIAERRARVALIDVSLLPKVDENGALRLRSLIEAGQLLGAQVALAGIRPSLANSLVASQIDVRGLCVVRDVQSGIEWALAQTGWRIEANG